MTFDSGAQAEHTLADSGICGDSADGRTAESETTRQVRRCTVCKRPAQVRWYRSLLRIGLIVAVAAAPAAAQLLYGGLVGTVTDANGAVVPAAKVTIVNTDTNLTRETTTDAQGSFSFANVLAGPYDVKVALEGFREVVRSRVPVTTGQISRVDLSLQVGALSESITV